MGNKYQRNSWSCVWLMLNLMECEEHAEEWLDRGYDEMVASRVICRNCPDHVLPCPWEFPAKNFVILRPLPPHPTPVVSLMTNPRGRPGALLWPALGKKSERKRDLLGSALFVNTKLSQFGVLYPEPCHIQVLTFPGLLFSFALFFRKEPHHGSTLQDGVLPSDKSAVAGASDKVQGNLVKH